MPLPALLRFLHAAPAEGVADAELLRRFAAARDEAAFELLVRRHAELVWKVCRGVLRQEADAEDAFQATFLALAKRAGSIRGPCVAGWLHRVAVRAALKLRARAARSPAVELPDLPAPAGPDPELTAAVHEELSRLADRDRLPVLLCDLEGHTHAEAAKVLGWPVGTVSGRLVRGRDRLRARLERRGVTPAAVLVAAVPGGVSGNLIRSAVSAVGGTASPAVVSLAEGVLSAMRTAKLKLLAAVSAAMVGVAGSGTFLAWTYGQPPVPGGPPPRAAAPAPPAGMAEVKVGEEPATAFPDKLEAAGKPIAELCPRLLTDDPPADAATDSPLVKLQKARLRELVRVIRLAVGSVYTGWGNDAPALQRLAAALDKLPAAVDAVEPTAEGRRRWYEERVALAKSVERVSAERFKTGSLQQDYLHLTRVLRVEAEIDLLKLSRDR
jgi:RNA polymerase sigma factor (sigma-70 family)